MLAQAPPEAEGGSMRGLSLRAGSLWASSGCSSLPLWQSRKTNSHTIKIAFANMTGKGGRRGKAEVMQGETADADGAPPVVEEKSDAKQREIEKRVLQCLVMTERDQLSKARLPYSESGL
jgi:hypothetical protein